MTVAVVVGGVMVVVVVVVGSCCSGHSGQCCLIWSSSVRAVHPKPQMLDTVQVVMEAYGTHECIHTYVLLPKVLFHDEDMHQWHRYSMFNWQIDE